MYPAQFTHSKCGTDKGFMTSSLAVLYECRTSWSVELYARYKKDLRQVSTYGHFLLAHYYQPATCVSLLGALRPALGGPQ